MNEELKPADEQALDALLMETLGNASPPDQTNEILRRWHESELVVARPNEARPGRRVESNQRSLWIGLVVAALAASLLIVVGLRSRGLIADPGSNIAGTNPSAPGGSIVEPIAPSPQGDDTDQSDQVPPKPGTRRPPRGIPLVIDSPASDVPPAIDGDQSDQSPSTPPLELALVSRQVDAELDSYWKSIGIDPTDAIEADKVVQRIAVALGVELDADSIADPAEVHEQLSAQSVSNAIAQRWLQLITADGLSRVEQDASDSLVSEFAQSVQGANGFDRLIAGLITGENSNSSVFLHAIAGSRKNTQAMVRRLAALTMNVDLRCTRCHDSYIEGSGRQEDYWAFTALVNRGIQHNGSKVVVDGARSDEPSFYELADGRQRFVEPGVSSDWLVSSEPISSVKQWASSLVGSPELARGVVNSLWQLVHGQPLHGRVVDPISAPHHQALKRIEDDLASDLIQSGFDVGRTLALIVTSPTTRRSVPSALLPEQSLVTNRAERQSAKNAVDAFAAWMPSQSALPFAARLSHVKRASGSSLSGAENASLGQFDDSNSNTRDRQRNDSLAADLPDHADALPVQWLDGIEDEGSQVEHLAYLAGINQVPESVLEVAADMRRLEVAPELRLQRLWWLLRP